jgi:thymidylate kinase
LDDGAVTRRGVWIALLGPDGAGKTAVLEGIVREAGAAFGEVRRFHLRPHFGRRSGEGPPVTDPHGRRRRGRWSSLAKLSLWWADCVVGYAIAVRPALRRRALVVFDRYVDDLLVDPRRYRYGGPMGLARAVVAWTPRPHLFVFLDAPDAVLRERKREVSATETARQRRDYLALAARLPRAFVVDASRRLDEVVGEVRSLMAATQNGGRG